MITTIETGGGCTALQVCEPDAPGFCAWITDHGGSAAPVDPEHALMLFGIYAEDAVGLPAIQETEIVGRSGLNAWYVVNVGYSPDEEEGTVAIDELIDRVGSHLLLRLYAERKLHA